MNRFYNYIRPFITQGDIQNRESLTDKKIVNASIELETAQYSNLFIMNYFYNNINQLIHLAMIQKSIHQVLDVGSAMGDIVSRIALQNPKLSFYAIDIMEEAVLLQRRNTSI